MDKNMINIDDLFKQRMTGAEERERPGAWLQMRELLDKEMPVAAPGAATNWRRMFGYAAGLVLLASATIGGYQAYTSYRNEPSKDIVAVNYNNWEAADNGANSTVGATGKTQNEPTQPKAGATSTIASNESGDNTAATKAGLTGNNSKTAQTVTTERSELVNASGKTSGSVTNRNNTVATAKTPGNKPTEKTSTNVTNSNKPEPPAGKSIASNNASGNQKESTIADKAKGTVVDGISLKNNKVDKNTATVAVNNAKSAPVKNTTPAANNSAANKPVPAAPERNFAAGNNVAGTGASKGSAPNKPSGNNDAAGNKAGQPAKPVEIAKNDNTANKTMIDKIETKETYDRKSGTWKQDTIDQGKVEWNNNEEPMLALKGGEVKSSNQAEILPSANIEANGKASNETEQLLPLSNFRTGAKNTNYTTSNFLEEMVKNTKMQLGGVKFYPGVLLGVNTALSGKNSMSGFQLGVTGALSLNDKWAIVSELKYMHRFKGQGESNRNDYFENIQPSGSGYVSDSMKHYFTYPSVSTFELPIMLRYSIQRFNVLVGGNMAYNLGFSPNEVTEKYTVTSATMPERPSNGAIIRPEDFRSRFGVGYQIGAGYQFSPAIGLDARISQSIWNSGSGAGVERVSREVYQTPTLLINFNYRFSNNKYKPYREH
jgi:hypothetical protein